MDITYQLTADDLSHISNFQSVGDAKRGALYARLILWGAAACAMGAIGFTAYRASITGKIHDAQFMICTIVGGVVLFPFLMLKSRKEREARVPKEAFHVRLSEDGLHVAGGDASGTRFWPSIVRIADDSMGIYFVNVTGTVELYVPKAAFSDSSEAAAFVAKAREYKSGPRTESVDRRLPKAGDTSVTFVLSEADLREHFWRAIRKGGQVLILFGAVFVGLEAFLGISLVEMLQQPLRPSSASAAIVESIGLLGVVPWILWTLFSPRRLIALYRKRGCLSSPTTISGTASGLTIVAPDGSSDLAWAQVSKIEVAGSLVEITGPAIGHVVPVAAFPTPDAARRFVAALNALREGRDPDSTPDAAAWPPEPASRE